MKNIYTLLTIALMASTQIPRFDASTAVYADDLKNTVIDLSLDRDPRTETTSSSKKEKKPSFFARTFNFKGMAWKMMSNDQRRKRLVQAITASIQDPAADPGGFFERYLTPERIQAVAQKIADEELSTKKSLNKTQQSVAKNARLEFAEVITSAILEEQAKEAGTLSGPELQLMQERVTSDLQACLQEAQNQDENQNCLSKFTRSVPFRIASEIFPKMLDQNFSGHWAKALPGHDFRAEPWLQFQRCSKEYYFDVIDRSALEANQIPVILQGCMLSSFLSTFDQLILVTAQAEITARKIKSINPTDVQAQGRMCLKDADYISAENGPQLTHFNQAKLQQTNKHQFEATLTACQTQVVDHLSKNIFRAVIRENDDVIRQYDPATHSAQIQQISDSVFDETYYPCFKKNTNSASCERAAKIQAAALILEQVVYEKEAFQKLWNFRNTELNTQIKAELKIAFSNHFLPCLHIQTEPELQFATCIDKITIEAGRIGAFWTLMQNSSVQKVFPDLQARKQFTHSILEGNEKSYEECVGHLRNPKKPELCKGLIIQTALRSIIERKISDGVRAEAFPLPDKKSKKQPVLVQCDTPMKGLSTQQKAYCDSQSKLQSCFASMKPQIIAEIEADRESDPDEIMKKAASCIVDSVSLASFYLTGVKIEEKRAQLNLSKAELPARLFQNQAQKCYSEKLRTTLSAQADPFATIETSIRSTQRACVALIQPRVETAVIAAMKSQFSRPKMSEPNSNSTVASPREQTTILGEMFDVLAFFYYSDKPKLPEIPASSDGSPEPETPAALETSSSPSSLALLLDPAHTAINYFARSEAINTFKANVKELKATLNALRVRNKKNVREVIISSPFAQNFLLALFADKLQQSFIEGIKKIEKENPHLGINASRVQNEISFLTKYSQLQPHFATAIEKSRPQLLESLSTWIAGNTTELKIPPPITNALGTALTRSCNEQKSFSDSLFQAFIDPMLQKAYEENRETLLAKVAGINQTDFTWAKIRTNPYSQKAIGLFADLLKKQISGVKMDDHEMQRISDEIKAYINKSMHEELMKKYTATGITILRLLKNLL